jgi:hypothetical protein
VGARLELARCESSLQAAAELFGEAPSRVIVSVPAGAVERVLAEAQVLGVEAVRIGETGGDSLRIGLAPLGAFAVPVAELRSRREACLKPIVGD